MNPCPEKPRKIGLIINPIAGMGGTVGLKGTDGAAILQEARRLGARPRARERTLPVLKALAASGADIKLYCFAGDMGESAAVAAGLKPVILGRAAPTPSAADTRRAAAKLLENGVALIVFTGGDGTARDLEQAVGRRVPVIGIPAGVKMYSPVFAGSPAAAGQLLDRYLKGEAAGVRALEVMDLDEQAFRGGTVAPELFGYLQVPDIPMLLQGPKISMRGEQENRQAIAQNIIENMREDVYYFIGPGTTTQVIMTLLELESTLVGIDVVCNRQAVHLDANEAALLAFSAPYPCRIIVTPIGGQGYLFGRGNQPISAGVIRQTGIDNIIVVATPEKIASLRGKPLQIDLNDPAMETGFPKYLKIITGYNETTMYPVNA